MPREGHGSRNLLCIHPVQRIPCHAPRGAWDSAQAAGFPDTGMLAPGYHADFAVLSDDILNIPAEDIDKIKVIQTYVDGQCVYER